MPREKEFERSSEKKHVPVRKPDVTSRRLPIERDDVFLFPRKKKRLRSVDQEGIE